MKHSPYVLAAIIFATIAGAVGGFYLALWIGDRVATTEIAAYYGLVCAFGLVPAGGVVGGSMALRALRE